MQLILAYQKPSNPGIAPSSKPWLQNQSSYTVSAQMSRCSNLSMKIEEVDLNLYRKITLGVKVAYLLALGLRNHLTSDITVLSYSHQKKRGRPWQ